MERRMLFVVAFSGRLFHLRLERISPSRRVWPPCTSCAPWLSSQKRTRSLSLHLASQKRLRSLSLSAPLHPMLLTMPPMLLPRRPGQRRRRPRRTRRHRCLQNPGKIHRRSRRRRVGCGESARPRARCCGSVAAGIVRLAPRVLTAHPPHPRLRHDTHGTNTARTRTTGGRTRAHTYIIALRERWGRWARWAGTRVRISARSPVPLAHHSCLTVNPKP